MGQIENKYQDGRFKSNHINNYINVNGLKNPTTRKRFSDCKSMLHAVNRKITLNVKAEAKSKRMEKDILCKHH